MADTVLVICAGNVCRSPMAAGLLDAYLAHRTVEAKVISAGVLGLVDQPADPNAVAAVAALGADITHHRSQGLERDLLDHADLVITMTREQLRETATLWPPAWPRSFTLKELVRRARSRGPRPDGVPLRTWAAQLSEGRTTDALLGSSPEDDIDDPLGQSRGVFEASARELDALVSEMVALLWPAHPAG